jgi:hypothetical protein
VDLQIVAAFDCLPGCVGDGDGSGGGFGSHVLYPLG